VDLFEVRDEHGQPEAVQMLNSTRQQRLPSCSKFADPECDGRAMMHVPRSPPDASPDAVLKNSA
jgi:hypothetical protein